MLKLPHMPSGRTQESQPPSGGCVLKQAVSIKERLKRIQPPSGGCVLKLKNNPQFQDFDYPAAFRRLCVETAIKAVQSNLDTTSRLQAAVC